MAEGATRIIGALETLRVRLSSRSSRPSSGPIVDITLDMDADEAVDLAADLAVRAGAGVPRAIFEGDGQLFAGVGASGTAAPEAPVVSEVRRLVGEVPHRRCVIAAPFPRSPRLRPAGEGSLPSETPQAWLPAVHWSWQDGRGVLAADLGDGGPGARAGTALLLDRLCTARALPQATGIDVTEVDLRPDASAHRAGVSEAMAAMASGAVDKVVLARRRRLRCTGGAADDIALRLWKGLERSGPNEVRYLVGQGDGDLVGVTPELLCRRHGVMVTADVLAGTASPGGSKLLDDPKERREHEAVRRFIVDTLSPVAVEVHAPTCPGLRRLRHVEHLHTVVTSVLRDARPVFDLLHPTPAVAGTPRNAALALIERLEPFERGLYAGAVGLADRDGEAVWVALRCALVRKGDAPMLELYVGSGLVPGSDAEREWHELNRKERTILGAIEGLKTHPVGPEAVDAA